MWQFVYDVDLHVEYILYIKICTCGKIVNKPYPQNHIVTLRATKPYKIEDGNFVRGKFGYSWALV